MHVVTCVPSYLPVVGGAELGTHRRLVRAKELSGHRFSVVAATDDLTLPRCEMLEGIEVHRFRRPMRFVRWYAPTAAATALAPMLVRSLEPDVVHASYALPTGVGAFAGAKLAGVPFIMTLGGNDVIDPVLPPPRPLRSAAAALARRAETVIAFSSTVRAEIVTNWGVPSERVIVDPFGVDTATFAPMPPDRVAAARKRFAIPRGFRVVVAVHRLEERKGTHVLLDALERWRPDDVVVLIAGRGREAEEIARRIAVADLGAFVRLLGFVDETTKRELLAMADLHVLPSLYEGQGIGIAEAAASGTPSVATQSGGTVDMVDHGITGWLVPSADPNTLAAALAEAMDDDERLAEMASAARSKAERELDLTVTVRAFLDALSQVTSGRHL